MLPVSKLDRIAAIVGKDEQARCNCRAQRSLCFCAWRVCDNIGGHRTEGACFHVDGRACTQGSAGARMRKGSGNWPGFCSTAYQLCAITYFVGIVAAMQRLLSMMPPHMLVQFGVQTV
ncbi:hypothetical protein [Bradyrhizobium embrapense]|uniref:hypothetical protein n=1 Tax=Bradyrhizobium embrapense TaxID=630921 RepID=UPI0012F48449|nr:hypothetical protein [Bradyrhizobium embrapense]